MASAFIIECISAAIERYRKQLLPSLAAAIMKYGKKAEYSGLKVMLILLKLL